VTISTLVPRIQFYNLFADLIFACREFLYETLTFNHKTFLAEISSAHESGGWIVSSSRAKRLQGSFELLAGRLIQLT
jgi:hypothetical protein